MLKGFFLQNPPTRKLAKKGDFWRQENREEIFPFFCRKLQTAKKTQEKNENTGTEKHYGMKKSGKEMVKRRFLQRKNFCSTKNGSKKLSKMADTTMEKKRYFFQKEKKRKNKRNEKEKVFLKMNEKEDQKKKRKELRQR